MVVATAVAASPASAAFPGANGLLAIQPVSGGGLTLVNPDGTGEHTICTSAVCGAPSDPAWSADGQELAFVDTNAANVRIVYPDGTCLNCAGLHFMGNAGSCCAPPPAVTTVAFAPTGLVGVGLRTGAVNTEGVDDTGGQADVIAHTAGSPTWSAGGRIAIVKKVRRRPNVFLTDATGRHVRRLTRDGASGPSWAPSGRSLAVVHAGFVEIVDLKGRVVRKLARGSSPTFSPDGRQVAFVGAGHQLFVIPVGGGNARPVGSVTGVHVDWQPAPSAVPPCQAPPGSHTVMSSPDAVLTARTSTSAQGDTSSSAEGFLACLRSDGRERFVAANVTDQDYKVATISGVGAIALAGPYVGLGVYSAQESPDYGAQSVSSPAEVRIVDLRTGFDAFSQPTDAELYPTLSVSALVLSPTGSLAWETDVHASVSSADHTQKIYAHDSQGTRTLDSETIPHGSPSNVGLANLTFNGSQVTWTHDGSARSATVSN